LNSGSRSLDLRNLPFGCRLLYSGRVRALKI
jgi:hypothetical protein